jgi:type III pantothenate kinase
MTERVLTADLGNSAVKLSAWGSCGSAERPLAQRRVAWGEELGRALDELGSVDRVLVCQVAGPMRWHEFERACAEAGRPLPFEPALDLAIGCRDHHTIGRDRLFAARGAWALLGEAAVVVDAGTALTVDALGVEAEAPCFLGGAIAPGPTLLSRALAGGAAQLFEVDARADAVALGQDSREALVAGISIGFQGAAKELVARLSQEAGLGDAPIALTGGAAALLSEAFPGRTVRHEPDLVALGLLAADGAARGI